LTTLDITKEIIQGIVATLSVVISCMLTYVTAMADWVVYWAVRLRLLRSVVSVVGRVVCAVACLRTGVHLGAMVIITTRGSFTTWPVTRSLTWMTVLLRRAKEHRVVGVCLDMFLQVLRTLESFAAKVTFVRLKRNMDSNMRSDVVTFYCGGTAGVPATSQVEVVCALASNMLFTDVFK
jgi:hypothetical protein